MYFPPLISTPMCIGLLGIESTIIVFCVAEKNVMEEKSFQKSKSNLLLRAKNSVENTEPTLLKRLIQIGNILIALCAVFLGIYVFFQFGSTRNGVDSFRLFVIAITELLLGVSLIIVSVPLGKFGKKIKLSFAEQTGILYTHRGRAVLILFIAALSFSSRSDDSKKYYLLPGILGLLHGLFSFFVYYIHPTYGKISLFPNTMEAPNDVQRSPNDFTGSVQDASNQRTQFDTYDYTESPFTIDDEDDAELGEFSTEDKANEVALQ